MPLYEFECSVCETKVTFMRRIDDRDAVAECRGDAVNDSVGKVYAIINGEEHETRKMVRVISRLGGAYVKGPRYA